MINPYNSSPYAPSKESVGEVLLLSRIIPLVAGLLAPGNFLASHRNLVPPLGMVSGIVRLESRYG